MIYLFFCVSTLVLAYLVNITCLSVFYHRGLTHNAVRLRPWMRRLVISCGNWLTGLDPKTWCCMHRIHHRYSDGKGDPHSPVNVGVLRVLKAQADAYGDTTAGLLRGDAKYTSIVPDLDFPVHWVSRNSTPRCLLPYLLHGTIALIPGLFFGAWAIGACYFVGLMSHPLQGWLVNGLGHRYGYRNFPTTDNSRNNTLVAWFILGEGFQNNHHQRPSSPTFAVKWWEVDMGYAICRIARALRMIDIPRRNAWLRGESGIQFSRNPG